MNVLGTAPVDGSEVGLQLHQWMAQLQVSRNLIPSYFQCQLTVRFFQDQLRVEGLR